MDALLEGYGRLVAEFGARCADVSQRVPHIAHAVRTVNWLDVGADLLAQP